MLITILAIWGAVVSSVALAWNIRRDIGQRGRLKVSCFVGNLATLGVGIEAENLLVWKVTNVGKEPVTLTTIGGAHKNGRHFLLHPRIQLPATLRPGEYVMDYSPDLTILNAGLKQLHVVDSLDRTYKAPARQVRKLIEQNVKGSPKRQAIMKQI